MGRRRTPSKPLTIEASDDKIIMTFNKAGWNPAHGKLLEFLAGDDDQKMTIAEYIGTAIEEYGKNHASPHTNFESLMKTMQIEANHDERIAAGENLPPSSHLWPKSRWPK